MIETAVEKFAGKGAKAHMIKVGPNKFFFSGSTLLAIERNGNMSISSEYFGHPGAQHRQKIIEQFPPESRNALMMYSGIFDKFAKESLGLPQTTAPLYRLVRLNKFAGDGANAVEISITNGKSFYFSYDNLIAIKDADGTLTVSEDIWGKTIKKHIKLLEADESNRMPRAEFEAMADIALAQFYLVPKVRWYSNATRDTRRY